MIGVNAIGLDALIADLARAEAQTPAMTRLAVAENAREVQQSWRRRWGGIRPAALAASVTFDIKPGLGSVMAEIGPDKSLSGGALGNLVEFGSSKNAPIPGGLPAADEQEPKFERSLAAMAVELLS